MKTKQEIDRNQTKRNHPSPTILGATQALIQLRCDLLRDRGLPNEQTYKQDALHPKKLSLLSCGAPLQLQNLEPRMRVEWHSIESKPESPHPNSPPPAMIENSSGDSSPCEDEQHKKTYISKKLSVEEVCKLVVNTGQYYLQLVDSKKTEKNEKVPQEWVHVKELILLNCDPEQEATKNKANIKKYFKEKFKVYPFVVIDKIEQVYFQGCFSYILRITEEIPAKFVYFNLTTMADKHRKFLGENVVIAQFRQHPDDEQYKYAVKLALRFLPVNITREKIQSLLIGELNRCRVEELFEYELAKYCVIIAENLELAEQLKERLVKYFNLKQYSQVDVQIQSTKKMSESNKLTYKQFFEKQEANPTMLVKKLLLSKYRIESPYAAKCQIPEEKVQILTDKTEQVKKRHHHKSSSSRSVHRNRNGDKKHHDTDRRKGKKKDRSRSKEKKHKNHHDHHSVEREKHRKRNNKNHEY